MGLVHQRCTFEGGDKLFGDRGTGRVRKSIKVHVRVGKLYSVLLIGSTKWNVAK